MKHVSSPSPAPPVRTVASVCCYCGTGCGVQVRTQGERVIEIAGDDSHPSSRGRLCTKGMNLAATVRRDASRVLTA